MYRMEVSSGVSSSKNITPMFSKNPRHWLIKFVIGCGQFWLVLRTAEETNDLRGVIRAGGAFRALAPQCEIQARQKAKAGAPIGGKLQPFSVPSARGHANARFRINQTRVRMRCVVGFHHCVPLTPACRFALSIAVCVPAMTRRLGA